jgi:hypothetical protein
MLHNVEEQVMDLVTVSGLRVMASARLVALRLGILPAPLPACVG